ncbi:MAG: class I SAM-dependent methyltransferase [Streptosporangiaceae bacterium]
MIGGHANAIPLGAATMDGARLSTVIHHLPDLPAAARELRRVLRPGAPVLIRSVFAGRHHGIGLFRITIRHGNDDYGHNLASRAECGPGVLSPARRGDGWWPAGSPAGARGGACSARSAAVACRV